jgi:hypothetical protein
LDPGTRAGTFSLFRRDLAAWVVQGYEEAGGFLFDRRTYERLASF